MWDKKRLTCTHALGMRLAVSVWGSSLLPIEVCLIWPLPTWSDVHCSVIAASVMPVYRYKFWFWKFKQAVPEEDGCFYNRAEREIAALRLNFLKTREDEGERGGLGRQRARNVWVVDHPPIFSTAVQQDGPEFTSLKCMSVSFHLMSNTWGIYRSWEECGVISQHNFENWADSCIFSFNLMHSCTHTNK